MKHVTYGVCVLIVIGCCISIASAQTVKVGMTEWKPWQMQEGEQFTGIMIDICQEVGRRTGVIFEFKALPHKRMMSEFQRNQIDAEVGVDPAWRGDQKDISVYSVPIVTTRDVILARKDRGIQGGSLESFFGLTLGCGLGYYYPDGFQEAFEDNTIFREDIPNTILENNILKMNAGRIDGAILNRQQAFYLLKQLKQNPDDFEVVYEFQSSPLSIRLHTRQEALLPDINSAIEAMNADSTIEAIVKRYLE